MSDIDRPLTPYPRPLGTLSGGYDYTDADDEEFGGEDYIKYHEDDQTVPAFPNEPIYETLVEQNEAEEREEREWEEEQDKQLREMHAWLAEEEAEEAKVAARRARREAREAEERTRSSTSKTEPNK